MSFRLSVVIATHDRQPLLRQLLDDLNQQTLPAERFEVVVVDDGSVDPVVLESSRYHYRLRLVRQANAGQAAARHVGIELGEGEVIVVLDDDMSVAPGFLSAHLSEHDLGVEVVMGQIQPSPTLATMPLFERFHAQQLAEFSRQHEHDKVVSDGTRLCTGNVSFRRRLYLAVGGFDRTLKRSEDRELGVRLQKAGARMVFCPAAESVHRSDHDSLAVWRQRAFLYGVYDSKISRRHPEVANADPWSFLGLVHPLSRPILFGSALAPAAAGKLGDLAMNVAKVVDRLGLEPLALAGTTLVYGIDYFRGVAEENRGVMAVLGDWLDYDRSAPAGRARLGRALKAFARSLTKDYAEIRRQRQRWFGEEIPSSQLPVDVVRKIGFQMMVMVRLMRLARDSGLPLGGQVVSRLIRHLYSAEIHWNAEFADGVSIVHGTGLVIGHAATISEGCILFQNVTLGEANHPGSKRAGAPSLGRNVHVGPGATLLGPITIGDDSKIMANALLMHSVPTRSLVRSLEGTIEARGVPTRVEPLA